MNIDLISIHPTSLIYVSTHILEIIRLILFMITRFRKIRNWHNTKTTKLFIHISPNKLIVMK